MGRPQKQTVDYFPHYSDASERETLFILESEFGNDGYTFWFKLLELLAKSEGHVYDVRNPAAWRFLLAKTHVTHETAGKILGILVEMGAIDKDLWLEGKMIWSQNLVDNVADVYRNRKADVPLKPSLNSKKPLSEGIPDVNNEVSSARNPQTKLKETKRKKKKEKDNTLFNKNEAQKIWVSTLEKLKSQVNKANYHTWLENTAGLNYEENQFVVGTPSASVAEYLDKNQRSLIEKTLSEITDRNIKVYFEVHT